MAASSRPDAAAIALSLMCLVHCLMLPLAISIIPTATRFLDLPEEVHAIIFISAVPISAGALFVGHRRHGLWVPAAAGFMGLVLIGAGAFAGLSALVETGISVVGSLFLLAGHVANMRATGVQKPGISSPDALRTPERRL